MKRWIKSFISVCIIVLMTLALAACAKTGSGDIDPDFEARLKASAEDAISKIVAMRDSEIDAYIEQFNSDQNTIYANGFNSWKNSKYELGAFSHYESETVTQNSKGFEVKVIAVFENRKCEIIYGVNTKLSDIYELSFNPVYSLKEKMGQAGINLIIGMGTVFAVLIFLTWIISLFKYINKAQTKLEAKKKAEAEGKVGSGQDNVAGAGGNEAAVQSAGTAGAQDEELQAVIAAAIAAYEADKESGIEKQAPLNNGIIVRSFKRGGDR